jgi:hypothetical protein
MEGSSMLLKPRAALYFCGRSKTVAARVFGGWTVLAFAAAAFVAGLAVGAWLL